MTRKNLTRKDFLKESTNFDDFCGRFAIVA